jgi:F0F1-type ATP synthase assembly protein I
MSPNSPPPNKNPMWFSAGSQFVMIGGEVGCLTLAIVLLSVFGGLWLDRLFGTKPVIMLILVLASAPLSLALTYWVAVRSIRSVSPASKETGKPEATEGDKTGE